MRTLLLTIVALSLTVGTAEAGAKANKSAKKGDIGAMMFEKLDADKDGSITKDEFKKVAEMGKGKGKGKLADKPELLTKLFEKLDANKDGKLSKDEFKIAKGDLRGDKKKKKPDAA